MDLLDNDKALANPSSVFERPSEVVANEQLSYGRRGYLGRFGFSGSLMGPPRADSTASRETTLPFLLPQEAHFFSAGSASRVNSRQSKQ
jgi:hypothetical protein